MKIIITLKLSKNKIWLEREQIAGFEVDEISDESILAAAKPMAKPEGSGKKKRKKKKTINADIWAGCSDSD